jgi:aminobenzoyl-glutamate utilization protein B
LTRGSTDIGDVSWQVPVGHLRAATQAAASPGHSWQIVACTGGPIGEKGGAVAAKALACTALDLLTDAALRQAARTEWQERRGDRPYTLLIPPDQPPPIPT